jgi:signal transduction histidine kinase
MTTPLLVAPIEHPDDVFVLRQRAREAAAAAGFEEVDQVRVATALSELGREVLAGPHRGRATFSLSERGTVLTIAIVGLPTGEDAGAHRAGPALAAAARLVDEVVQVPAAGGRPTVVLHKHLPAGRASRAEAVRSALAAAPTSPLDELRAQNLDLIATLDELTSRRDELLDLNAELEETNRGVLAMYGQLSDELAETNRGVLALYAELDEKSVELAQASEAKSRFLASVSHELRSPVSSIIGLADLLSDTSDRVDAAEQRRQVQLIEHSARQLLELVNGLLDLARAESGRLEPERSTVDLHELAGELRGTLQPLVPAGVALEIDLAPDVVAVDTDRDLLTQVLRNLLVNALAFTSEGSVRLLVRMLSPAEVVIEVADTGIGIAPADQERVFEEFYQVKGPLQTRRQGSGLGLPYARRVVHALGGSLTLRSTPGEGSTFAVALPVRWVESLTRSTSRGGEAPDRGDGGAVEVELALVVDDDEGFRRILRGMLQGVAGQVIEAASGKEAIDRMQQVRPDVVFLDLRMPDMDGSDVLEHMRELPLRDVPVVVISSVDLSASTVPNLGRSAATLAKAALDRPLLRRILAEVLTPGPTEPEGRA